MAYLTRLTVKAALSTFPMVAAWWTIFIVWHCVALLLVVRRLSSALVQPLPGWGLLTISAVVVAFSALIRGYSLQYRLRGNEIAKRILVLLPTVVSLLVIASVTIPGSPLFSSVVAWGVIIAAETAWLMIFISAWRRRSRPRGTSRSAIASSPSTELPGSSSLNDAIGSRRNLDDESLPPGVTQQLIRSRHAEGEAMSGLLRIDFSSNEFTQVAHLVFSPAFVTVPAVDVAQVSGPDVSIKVSQVESFGVRIELKRHGQSVEPCSVVLEVEATAMDG